VRSLAESGERPCGTFGIPLAKTTLSHHFKVLREAGIISIRVEGTQRMNSLRRTDLESRFPGLLSAVLNAQEAAPAPTNVAATSHAATGGLREPELAVSH
jgi:DNA-binding transcriptional ArsR family regulator